MGNYIGRNEQPIPKPDENRPRRGDYCVAHVRVYLSHLDNSSPTTGYRVMRVVKTNRGGAITDICPEHMWQTEGTKASAATKPKYHSVRPDNTGGSIFLLGYIGRRDLSSLTDEVYLSKQQVKDAVRRFA